MSVQYICNGAVIKCSCGDAMSNLQVLSDRTVILTNENYGNISDHESMVNIKPFGLCSSLKYPPTKSATSANHGSLTPMPCKPGTMSLWENGNDSYLVRNFPALQSTSYCRCIYGGVVTIVNDGQKSNLYELEKSKDLQNEENSSMDVDKENSDLGIDAVDFIPVVGSLRDIKTGLVTGSMGMVAMGTVFLILDASGLVSFGSGTAGSIALKTTLKAGIKSTAKATGKAVTKEVLKQSEKELAKEAATNASKAVAKDVVKQSEAKLFEITITQKMAEGIVRQGGKEIGENVINELGKAAIKNEGKNIFKIGTKTAETGAKEATKNPKAEQQIIKNVTDKAMECVEKMPKQIDDLKKIGKEYIERITRQISKDYPKNSNKFEILENAKKATARSVKPYEKILDKEYLEFVKRITQ